MPILTPLPCHILTPHTPLSLSDVTINYLAEVVQDSVVQVRFAVAQMLTVFLTEIMDRYDHQTRLIPYLLDLLCDSSPVVSEVAMACITKVC